MKIIKLILKYIIAVILTSTLFIILSNLSFINFLDKDNFTNVNNMLFTSITIIFSVGFSLLISFDIDSIKNIYVLKKMNDGLKDIRDKMILFFFIAILIFIFSIVVNIDKNYYVNMFFKIKLSVVWNSFCISGLLIVLLILILIFKYTYDKKIELKINLMNEQEILKKSNLQE
ncbi:hypothetical protein [Brachyspira sp. SAP_772]|uniref:hypothetical protein n=1 Tax=Brachyspira sp. SAP_772 TaxID=2608385 RepID=UPI0012F4FA56|nr:hypothetical protein [Brachyspira sp. SAP_772]